MFVGLVACIVESNFIGNMNWQESLTSLWQIMSPNDYINYNTQNPKVPNMHQTNGNAQTMEQQQNGTRNKVHYLE